MKVTILESALSKSAADKIVHEYATKLLEAGASPRRYGVFVQPTGDTSGAYWQICLVDREPLVL